VETLECQVTQVLDCLDDLEEERIALVKEALAAGSGMGHQVEEVPDGQSVVNTAMGAGPVEASFRAVEALVGESIAVVNYSLQAQDPGADALGLVTLVVNLDGHLIEGRGADSDIVVASVKALIDALNRRAAGVLVAC
jgi:2-isopropylmalate synthase